MTQAHQTGRQTLRRAAARLSGLETGIVTRGAAALVSGFLLAALRLSAHHAPVALALVAALEFGIPAVCAYFGAVAGYLVFWGLSAALEPVTAGFLILAETCIFSGLLPRERTWFMPASGALLYTLAGILQLVQCSFAPEKTLLLLLRLAILAVCCAQFDAALRGKQAARLFFCLCLIAGSAAIRLFGVPLGAIPAAALALLALDARQSALFASAGGLALELAGAGSGMTACFFLASLLARQLAPQRRFLRGVLFVSCVSAGMLLSGQVNLRLLFGVALGALLALRLPEALLRPLQCGGEAVSPARLAQTALAADVLARLGRTLGRARVRNVETQSAAIFDRAAETACRSCAKWSVCWEARASDTYLALSRAGGRIVRRGQAMREDLPEAFLAQCTDLRRFLQAVNDALDEQRSRRQYQNRLAESRIVLAGQLCAASRLLQRALEPEPAQPAPCFTAELGACAHAAEGGAPCGDCFADFTCGEWYYLALCDAMGSGEEAAREAQSAVSLLRDLICAGLEAQDALELLNGVYILRGDGVFSTVDLAQVSLISGEGFLLKWGAAPSYLQRGGRIVRLGAQTLPPGLSAAGEGGASCLRISLLRGETLVLLSDGADDGQTERRLRSFAAVSTQALADELAGAPEADADDDRTALVLRLRPVPARRALRRTRSRSLRS